MSSESRSTFFKQSGWMFITTLISGVLMFAVHSFGLGMPQAEYGLFTALLGVMNIMAIPTLGLPTIFAQQTASAVTESDKERLTATMQTILLWTFVLWVLFVVGAVLFQRQIMNNLTIYNPLAWWMTLAIGLGQLWIPILAGTMQGQQNFLWMGWGNIINGGGRFLTVAVIVAFFSITATGAIFGAWLGIFGALVIGLVQTRSVWFTARPKIDLDWKSWLKKILPLTLALGASQFIFSIDVIFARSLFGETGTGYFAGAGTIGRGLVIFTAPLTVVMFPKIVKNLSHGKKSNLLMHTLVGTLLLGMLAAVACTIVSFGLKYLLTSPDPVSYVPQALVAKLKAKEEGVLAVSGLIPWFVWAMLPLALANVLLNNLVARQRFHFIPYSIGTVLAYALALAGFARSFVGIIQILGCFNLLYFAVLAFFTWLDFKRSAESGAVPGE